MLHHFISPTASGINQGLNWNFYQSVCMRHVIFHIALLLNMGVKWETWLTVLWNRIIRVFLINPEHPGSCKTFVKTSSVWELFQKNPVHVCMTVWVILECRNGAKYQYDISLSSFMGYDQILIFSFLKIHLKSCFVKSKVITTTFKSKVWDHFSFSIVTMHKNILLKIKFMGNAKTTWISVLFSSRS